MKKERKTYSKEFKQQAIELSNVRGNVQEVARELGISAEMIYRWRRESDRKPDLAFSGKGIKQLTPEQKELARLQRELADVKMERDILKKAVSIFSVSDRKSSSL
jgi:transposase